MDKRREFFFLTREEYNREKFSVKRLQRTSWLKSELTR